MHVSVSHTGHDKISGLVCKIVKPRQKPLSM